jgi:hypothetical protein
VLLETAVAIPVLLVVVLAAMWVVGIGAAQLRVGDGAREAVRVAARGEDGAAVRTAAHRSAPGASVEVGGSDDLVWVRVQQRIRPPIPFLRGLGVTVDARATAAREPAADESLVLP